MIGWSHSYVFGTETPHTRLIFSDRGCTDFSRNQHRLSPKSTHRLHPPILEWHEVSCRGRTGRMVQKMHGVLPEVGRVHAQAVEVQMVEEPPTWLISDNLFVCAWVDTCHPCNCVHSIPLEVTFPSKRTKGKAYYSHSFWNNIKILSPRLNPLGSTLSPSSHLPTPNPLPTLWNLSPPSLIHRGRSAHGGVYIFINNVHRYMCKIRLLAFNT
jgi:hypothetical protein